MHSYALLKIVDKKIKLPLRLDKRLPPYNCVIQTSIGLPYYYTIRARQDNPRAIRLVDIYPYQWFSRENEVREHIERRILLNPVKVNSKGRPIGVKGKKKGDRVSSTRRDPSEFKYINQAPLSTAPRRLKGAPPRKRGRPLKRAIIVLDKDKEEPAQELPGGLVLTANVQVVL